MKKEIHPALNLINAHCATCNKEHELLSTAKEVTIDVCSGCHAFYTGDNSIVKAPGQIERFRRRAAAAANLNKK